MSDTNTTDQKNNQDLRTVRLASVADLPKDFKVHTDHFRWLPHRWFPILNRYIFMEIIGPFVVALAFFTMIYMIMALQKMVGLFVGKGVDPFRMLDYMGYLLGNTLPNTIPMACLMSGIMAAGRLSGDSEITAMRSAGVSFFRIYLNFLIFGFFVALFVAYLNFYLSPESSRKLNEFNNWILAYNPLLAVTPGQFSGDSTQEAFQKRGRTMYTEGLDQDTGLMKGVQIREWEVFLEGSNEYIRHNNRVIPMGGSRVTQIISAKHGYMVEKKNDAGQFEKAIRLKEGFVIEWNELKDGLSVTNFINGEMDYNVKSDKEKKVIGFNIKPETFSFPALIKIRDNIESEGFENIPGLEMVKEMGLSIKGVDGLESMIEQMKRDIIVGATNKTVEPSQLSNQYAVLTQLMGLLKDSQKTLTAFNVEIHKRVAMPISCQIFFFLSFPLGLVVKRSGKGMSFTLAIVFLFIYYVFFIIGSGVSYKSKVPDWIGPWSANIVIACISLYIMATRTDINIRDSAPLRFLRFINNRISIYLQKIYVYLSPVLNPIFAPIRFAWKWISWIFRPVGKGIRFAYRIAKIKLKKFKRYILKKLK
ncbi:MAG: LptF/LptG family permease [Leptospiraceae bacterium]|nr:LptF/LptG family permease [Leptospiraceae bacterium]